MATKAPLYREAYPRLDIRGLQAGFHRNRVACRYTDQTGFEFGQAFIWEVRDQSVIVGFGLHAPYIEYKAGLREFAIDHSPDPVNHERHFFRCPGCGLARKTLFFKGDWSCAECHRLVFRSQLVRSDVRNYEWLTSRRHELQLTLARGRPHRMRQTTFDQLRLELNALDRQLAASPCRVASAEHRHVVTGSWVEPGDLPNGLWFEGFEVMANTIEKTDWFVLPPEFRR